MRNCIIITHQHIASGNRQEMTRNTRRKKEGLRVESKVLKTDICLRLNLLMVLIHHLLHTQTILRNLKITSENNKTTYLHFLYVPVIKSVEQYRDRIYLYILGTPLLITSRRKCVKLILKIHTID